MKKKLFNFSDRQIDGTEAFEMLDDIFETQQNINDYVLDIENYLIMTNYMQSVLNNLENETIDINNYLFLEKKLEDKTIEIPAKEVLKMYLFFKKINEMIEEELWEKITQYVYKYFPEMK